MENVSENLNAGLEEEVRIESLDRRLEMGLWLFDTHDGETASCGLTF